MYPKQKAFHNHIFVFDLHRSFCVNPCHLWETITHPATLSQIGLIGKSNKCRYSCNDISKWNQLKEYL